MGEAAPSHQPHRSAEPFDPAQDKPFDPAQDKPFGFAVRPAHGGAQDRRSQQSPWRDLYPSNPAVTREANGELDQEKRQR